MSILLAMSLSINSLQANFFQESLGEILFFTSFFTTWRLLIKPKVQQKPINDLKLDTIIDYQEKRYNLRGLIADSASNEEKDNIEKINDLAEQAFISTLHASVADLKNKPEYKNKNTKIIKHARLLAKQAHDAVHEEAEQERIQIQQAVQQAVTHAVLTIIAENRRREAKAASLISMKKSTGC